MTVSRRLSAVETSLGPTQLVLQILAEARTFDALHARRREGKGPRPLELAGHEEELAGAWDSWQQVVAGLQATRTVEEDAREQLEARYLGGQPSLLAETAAEWSTFADMVDRIGSLAERLVPPSRAEGRGSSREGGQLFDDRIRERARKLADDAGSRHWPDWANTRARWRS